MANYSFAQLEQLWIQAGGPVAVAPIAAAIALAESSGNSDAMNYTDNNGTQTSVGLWQVSTGTHSYPPAWQTPTGNAAEAVAKYRGAGNTFAPWGTYVSGIYRQFLSGAAPATGALPASSGSGAQSAQLTSWTSGGAPLDLAAATSQASQSLFLGIPNPWSIVESTSRLAKDFNTLVGLLNAFLHDIEWLFVPSHWVRVFCFIFGVGALLPGMWALMQTGSGKQGDITMAIGVLLVTVAGVLLFLAFHNLPTDVRDLGGLLTFVAAGIARTSAPAKSSTAQPAGAGA
jgi:hypothetical protein